MTEVKAFDLEKKPSLHLFPAAQVQSVLVPSGTVFPQDPGWPSHAKIARGSIGVSNMVW